MTAWFSAGSFAVEGNRDEECSPDCTAIVGGDHEPACRAAGARVRVVNRDSIFLGETGTVAHVYASGTRIVELDGYGTAVPFGYTELEGVER